MVICAKKGSEAQVIELERKPAPFLKWAGGKTRLLPQFEQYFPPRFQRYFEPFAGSGAVFFYLLPEVAMLNDANPTLIAAYQHLRDHVDVVIARLYEMRLYYHAMTPEQQRREYYRARDLYNRLSAGTIEKSALLIFLNKTGYNGLYRENSRGEFNVPFGRYDNPALFDEANLRAVSRALQDAELSCDHYHGVVQAAQAGDFVYFDPPYLPLSKTASFTSYTKEAFSLEQQAELAALARHLSERGVLVMLSNSNSPVIRDLYKDFCHHAVWASRAVNSKAGLRGKIPELVITNYVVP